MFGRLFKLRRLAFAAVLVIAPWVPALAHTCCYSSYTSTNTYPAGPFSHCEYMQDKWRHWQEYVPATPGDPHEHEWISGTYLISTTGPHRYSGCEGP